MVYVDDFIVIARTKEETGKVIDSLEQRFPLKRLGDPKKFLGLEIERDRAHHTITLRQSVYANAILQRFGMSDAKPNSTPMATNLVFGASDGGEDTDAREYQAMVGSVMYLMLGTRPDLAYSISTLSRYCSNPSTIHLTALKRILRYIKATSSIGLVLGSGREAGEGELGDIELVGYADAAFGDDVGTGKSTSGYVFMLGIGAISWSSKRQPLVTLSTTEAEYVGGTIAAKEAIWLRELLQTLGLNLDTSTIIYGDNQGSLALANNPDFHARTKHINIRYHFIRQCIEDGLINYQYLETSDMVADCLTKALPRNKHERFAQFMGLEMARSGGSVEV
jgi:hypothetical protein